MNRFCHITLTALSLATSPALADDPPNQQAKSAAARAVFAKRDAAVAKALAAYQSALHEADKQLVADVDAALKRSAVSKDVDATSELSAAKRSAQARLKESKSTDPEAVIVAATYGNLEKSVDVLAGVRRRLAKDEDIWVDKNITDGRLQLDGDLRLVFRAAGVKSIILTCRHGSRISISR